MRRLRIGLVGLCLAACGGEAFVDGPGTTSGEAGSAATAGAGGVGASGGGISAGGQGGAVLVGCGGLLDLLVEANAAAVACSPYMPQCAGTAAVTDTCGCPVLANETSPEAVAAAHAAYDAWVEAQCGPYPCGQPCMTLKAGFCMETGPGSGEGVCAIDWAMD